jgi:formate dehydrogenase subunit gamma
MTRYLVRYRDSDRMNHWAVAVLFLAAALSGLAFFHPALFGLSGLFGGGPWARILHPFLGVLGVLAFAGMFARVWRDNLSAPGDRRWLRNAGGLMRNEPGGEAAAEAETGRYNAGQKIVFWIFSVCLAVLLVTGFLFWRPWFADSFTPGTRRLGALLHSIAATVMLVALIVHIYAAIWVKGSVRAMTRGIVSTSWARRHHPRWSAPAAPVGDMARRAGGPGLPPSSVVTPDTPRPVDAGGGPPFTR